MHDDTLLKVALGLSLVGIITLYFLQSILLPPLEMNSDWNSQDTGKLVRTQGTVVKTWNQNNQSYATLNQSCLLTAVLPKDILKDTPFPIGSHLEITGKYNEYGNKKEVQAEQVRMIE